MDHLVEVKICMSRNGFEFIDCPNLNLGNCGLVFRFLTYSPSSKQNTAYGSTNIKVPSKSNVLIGEGTYGSKKLEISYLKSVGTFRYHTQNVHTKVSIGKNLELTLGHRKNRNDLEKFFSKSKFDGVNTFVGLKAVGENVENPRRYFDNNVVGIFNLYKVMTKHNCKKMVFSSSATVYGQLQKIPCVEDFKLQAMNPYGRIKVFLEEIARDIQKAEPDWGIILLRYFNPVGTHESGKICEDPRGIPNNLMTYIQQVVVGRIPELNVYGHDYPTRDGSGIMMERDTGRPCGFGFITFSDRCGMEDAIKEMTEREVGDRIISVNKAQPRAGGDDADQGYRCGYSSGGRGSYGAGDRVGQDDCFKCGRPGHWVRDCPLAGGDGGCDRDSGSFSSCLRFGGAGGHGDRLGERERYIDDRIISFNKAQPRAGGAGDRVGQDDCFKCGRPGHWVRDCPLAGGDGGCDRGSGSFSSCPRFGGAGRHGDRLGERERYIDDHIISVNKAQPRAGGAGDRVGQDDCFKCGRPGHWVRDCPLAGGDGGCGWGSGSFSSCPRFGGAGGHGDRLGERERYIDDRYDRGGRYGDMDCLDNRDYKYSGRDRYASDRYATSGGDRFADRYGSGSDYPQNGYGKERGYNRYGGARGGADRNGNGIPACDEGRSYRGRPAPYDRPSRTARPSSFDRY